MRYEAPDKRVIKSLEQRVKQTKPAQRPARLKPFQLDRFFKIFEVCLQAWINAINTSHHIGRDDPLVTMAIKGRAFPPRGVLGGN